MPSSLSPLPTRCTTPEQRSTEEGTSNQPLMGDQAQKATTIEPVANEVSESHVPPCRLRITGYRLLITTITIGLGTWKAVLTSRAGRAANALDWVVGTVLAILLFWAERYANDLPDSILVTYLFKTDYSEKLWIGIGYVSAWIALLLMLVVALALCVMYPPTILFFNRERISKYPILSGCAFFSNMILSPPYFILIITDRTIISSDIARLGVILWLIVNIALPVYILGYFDFIKRKAEPPHSY